MAMECRGSEPARPLVNSSLEIGPRTMESHLHPREFGPSVDSARLRRVLSVGAGPSRVGEAGRKGRDGRRRHRDRPARPMT